MKVQVGDHDTALRLVTPGKTAPFLVPSSAETGPKVASPRRAAAADSAWNRWELCMQVLRNVFRRKLRVFLTIAGIAIGVLALVVMGSMAEKINLLVSGGTRYYSDKVIVNAEGSGQMFSTGPLDLGKLEQIKAVPGVAEVSGQVSALLETGSSMSMGMPAMIIGSDMRGDNLESFKLDYCAGPDDRTKRRRVGGGGLRPGEQAVREGRRATSPYGVRSSRSPASWTRP